MDHTSIHPSCEDQAYRIDLHLWRGAPQNLDETRPVEVLVNDGYVVGFCADRLQPVWSAYRVAHADDDVDFDRPLVYYNDTRLPEEHRIGRRTFGKLGGIQLNVGHMTPNEVINRQFGRLAQLETFLMSNMSPQYQSLNMGVWSTLERSIREIEDEPGYDHVWAIVGPVFGEDPASINRGAGKYLPVPDSYFCIVVDPFRYPYDTPSRVHIDCFIIPQDAETGSSPEDYPATLEEIEEATNLKFFEGWGRDLPLESSAAGEIEEPRESRLRRNIRQRQLEAQQAMAQGEEANLDVETIDGLIDLLKAEAAQLQIRGRALTIAELAHLRTLQHTISWLIRARDIARKEEPEEEDPPTLITYKIVADMGNRLREGARTACSFWNRFVRPSESIVIRLGTFTQNSNTIARAYKPYDNEGIRYGLVEFNTKYLGRFTENEIAGTIVHEIGHSLGFGWDRWKELFDEETGEFSEEAVELLGALQHMEVELDGGLGTALAHWDEDKFDTEIMTGIQDTGEYVLPVTINIMRVLGHEVIEELEEKTPLADLLQAAASVVFSRQDEVVRLDLEYFEETELLETIPHEITEKSA